ncbi:hypothetical protein Poly30_39690 [Planctomycetes bacterium Poly30]|uniref:Uncharacterized protein n=2 Tax=Saltatorellus ferox TaxID=2528018 RepID=A0A518EWE9_9BACT|nr:hypothetical protein Poly30_39690 [Planctomycetes bacterium Poly30]
MTAVAAPQSEGPHSEAPIYVIARGQGFDQGLARISAYSDGGVPTLTYLMDLPPAGPQQVSFSDGLAWDGALERLIVSATDGFAQQFFGVDLATQTTHLLFEDDLPVQMQGFALGSDGIGYGQHLGSTEVLEIDLELQSVGVAGDFGAATGSALALSPDGSVYALDMDTVLRRFDPVTSQTTVIGPTYLWGTAGMDFTEDGRLFVLMTHGQLFELDPHTGAIDQVSFVNGLEFFPGAYYALAGMTVAVPRPSEWSTLCGSNQQALLPVGQASVASNDFELASHGLPPNVFAMVIASESSQPPATTGQFAGAVCLGPPIARLGATIQLTAPDGRIRLRIDLSSGPSLGGMAPVVAGDTRFFQLWYRHQQASTTSEFTSAIEVRFQ